VIGRNAIADWIVLRKFDQIRQPLRRLLSPVHEDGKKTAKSGNRANPIFGTSRNCLI
jgi:hypothetical protein